MQGILQKLSGEIRSAVDGIGERELAYRPSEGKWSTAEVLEHLQRTYTGTSKGLERVLERGAPMVTPVGLKLRIAQWYVTCLGRLPEGRKSPKAAEPTGTALSTELPRTIFEKLAEMDALLVRCEERFGRGKLMDHPILGALNPAEWRKFHLAHGRHHLKQVRDRVQAAR